MVTTRHLDLHKVDDPPTQTLQPMIVTFDYSLVSWIRFLAFNIGNPAVEAGLTGTRILIGLLQSISVGNARFRVVPLAVVVPVVKYVSLHAPPYRDADITQGSVILSRHTSQS